MTGADSEGEDDATQKEPTTFKNLRSVSPKSAISTEEEDLTSLMSTYTAAFFNLGVSFEHLGHFELSLMAYKKGRKICYAYLSQNQGLITSLSEAIESVSVKAFKKQD